MRAAAGAALLAWLGCGDVATPPPPPAPGPVASSAAASPPASSADPLQRLTLESPPDWMDKYAAHRPPGDLRFFRIGRVMREFDLSRAAAVELQNHYRDLTRNDPDGDRAAHFETARDRARTGIFESPRRLDRLARAPFIVVIDLDETLYDQYYAASDDCVDVEVTPPDGTRRRLKLTPGWRRAIDRIVGLGGAVAIFSANLDETNYENLDHILVDGTPLHRHETISGFLTNSHLILQATDEGDPVVRPSKDLRLFDPTLKRVILVDDNPLRVVQRRNLRVFKKFDAAAYCRARPDDPRRRAYEAAFGDVVDEIEEAAAYTAAHEDVDFVTAFAPYTQLGRIAVDTLVGAGLRRSEAIDYLRREPSAIDESF
ncbi:MAG: NIF family HAD-type phosphatase [Myxococcota bacterium]